MVPFYRFCSHESIHHRKIDLSKTASSAHSSSSSCSLSSFLACIIICSSKTELVDGDVLPRRALRLGPHGLRRVEVLAEVLKRLPLFQFYFFRYITYFLKKGFLSIQLLNNISDRDA